MSDTLNIIRFQTSERLIESSPGNGAYNWDTRVKIFLLFVIIFLNIGLAVPIISTILLLIGMIILAWSKPPLGRIVLFFSGPIIASIISFIGFSFAFGHTSLFSIGSISFYQEGVELGLGVILRIYCDVTWLAIAFATTPFPKIIKALKWFKIPEILIDTISLMYRYSFLLVEEFSRMYTAALARGSNNGKKTMIKVIARICAQIFIRAFDRSERIYMSMMARGEGDSSDEEDIDSKTNFPMTMNVKSDLIKMQNVSYNYNNEIKALNNINLSVKPGESIAICGSNGSGKTTLLKLCFGIILPSSGKVELMGTPLDNKSRRKVYKHAGFLFQDADDQLFCPTVEEDIAFGPENLKLNPEEIKSRVQEAMKLMKIQHLASRPIHDLSGGEKKRVALAGLIAMKNKLMILDEPTSGLDPEAALQFVELLKELNEKFNYTFLVSMHDIESVTKFARRKIIIKDGSIVKDELIKDAL